MNDLLAMPGVRYDCMERMFPIEQTIALWIMAGCFAVFILGVIIAAAIDYRLNGVTGTMIFGGLLISVFIGIVAALGFRPVTYIRVNVNNEGKSATEILEKYNVRDIEGTSWLIEYKTPEPPWEKTVTIKIDKDGKVTQIEEDRNE